MRETPDTLQLGSQFKGIISITFLASMSPINMVVFFFLSKLGIHGSLEWCTLLYLNLMAAT